MIEVYEYDRRTYSVYKPADATHPATGYYLTSEELENIQSELRKTKLHKMELQTKLDQLRESHETEIQSLKDSYEISLGKARHYYESQYAADELLKEKREKQSYKKAAEIESEFNRNFKRIAKERANKKRNINKNESGYLILNWKPTIYTLRENGESTKFQLYMINIQTPWDCSLSLEVVDKLVIDDIHNKSSLILRNTNIGIFIVQMSLDEAINTATKNEYDISNLILTRNYQSNVRTGLWEVTFITGFEPIINEQHRKTYV